MWLLITTSKFLLIFCCASWNLTIFSRRSLQIARQIGDRALEAQACYSLGNTYTLLRDYNTAIEYHLMHLHIAQELNDRVGEGRACWSLGNAHTSLGDHQQALQYAKQHLDISKEASTSTFETYSIFVVVGILHLCSLTNLVNYSLEKPLCQILSECLVLNCVVFTSIRHQHHCITKESIYFPCASQTWLLRYHYFMQSTFRIVGMRLISSACNGRIMHCCTLPFCIFICSFIATEHKRLVMHEVMCNSY
jgi:tetratricopeptide (TPR) repeat protein